MAVKGRKNGDELLAATLAGGATVEQAAEKTGLGERTIYRRLNEPEFRQLLGELRAATLQAAADRLATAGAQAVTTLVELLNVESDNVRLGAARAIIELGIRIRETGEMEKRLLELEVNLNGGNNGT